MLNCTCESSVLEKQLDTLNEEIKKETWVSLLYSVRFDEITSEKWHLEFEKLAPEEHQAFLQTLGLPSEEIKSIREWYQKLNRQEA